MRVRLSTTVARIIGFFANIVMGIVEQMKERSNAMSRFDRAAWVFIGIAGGMSGIFIGNEFFTVSAESAGGVKTFFYYHAIVNIILGSGLVLHGLYSAFQLKQSLKRNRNRAQLLLMS